MDLKHIGTKYPRKVAKGQIFYFDSLRFCVVKKLVLPNEESIKHHTNTKQKHDDRNTIDAMHHS